MILISPQGHSMSERAFLTLLHRHHIFTESVFRRHEMNHIIQLTTGTGIDVGCGLNKIHSSAIGIDKRLGPKDVGYPFGAQIQGSGDSLPWFEDESLDYVFSSHALEHIVDTESALREWRRVIAPGGRLILILPDKRRYPKIGQPGANPDHKHDFDPSEITSILERVGFEIQQIDTLSRKLENDPWAVREAPKYGHKTLNFSFEVIALRGEDGTS